MLGLKNTGDPALLVNVMRMTDLISLISHRLHVVAARGSDLREEAVA